MAQDRTRALFGDSPPPKRQPAPYPEGDIIYNCNNRFVVRHGDTITKYTTFPHGFGTHDHPNESLALRFIKEHTTIPVPERSEILAQLRDYIAQMRRLGGIYLGRVDGQGVVVPSIFTRSGGPFRTMSELHDWLVRPPIRLEAESMYWHQITTHLGAEYPIVFTHGDIAARNILVSGGRIVALLDWEFAGWYPDYWDYVFALRGLDNIDWKTLGEHIPSLFTKRYDLEYILVQFLLRIS
ncbi:Protein kinase-like protein [Metarhizium brunneum]